MNHYFTQHCKCLAKQNTETCALDLSIMMDTGKIKGTEKPILIFSLEKNLPISYTGTAFSMNSVQNLVFLFFLCECVCVRSPQW